MREKERERESQGALVSAECSGSLTLGLVNSQRSHTPSFFFPCAISSSSRCPAIAPQNRPTVHLQSHWDVLRPTFRTRWRRRERGGKRIGQGRRGNALAFYRVRVISGRNESYKFVSETRGRESASRPGGRRGRGRRGSTYDHSPY